MLVLPIKKKWFDMILSGKKSEEYRDFTPYWKGRFANEFSLDRDTFLPTDRVMRPVLFRNGYSKDSPSFKAFCVLSDVREGNPAWGAEKGKKYYVLRILKVCGGKDKMIVKGDDGFGNV